MTNELTKEETERNTIIAKWYCDKQVNEIFRMFSYKYFLFHRMDATKDLKQEVFIRLTLKPIERLRELDDADAFPQFIVTIIHSFGYYSKLVKTIFEYAMRSRELVDWKHDHLAIEDPESIKSNEHTLIDEVIKEVNLLPMLEKSAINIYSEGLNAEAVRDRLNAAGFLVKTNPTRVLIRTARETVLNNLLKNEFIETIPEFVKNRSNFNKFRLDITNDVRIAKSMLRIERLAGAKSVVDYSLPDKALYVLIKSGKPAMAKDIVDGMIKDDPELIKIHTKEKLLNGLNNHLLFAVHTGIVYKRKVKQIYNEYFISDIVIDYLQSVKLAPIPFNPESARKWIVYLYHKNTKLSFERISSKMTRLVEDVEHMYQQASVIVNEIYECKMNDGYDQN